ncbi:unnamed protein product [Heterobilharzia americana]|nr:unnamed protein product [Heterobilharzia americana]
MDEFIIASKNAQSPFAQPFVVSLPLPKSIQGGSGQQASIYDSSKPHHHESNDLSLCMLSNNCQRRTSMDGGNCKQLLLSSNTSKDVKPSTFHSKSRSYAETVTRGYVVTPGVEGISMNKFNYRESQIENQIYTASTAPLNGAYECSMSDPSTEQTTLATTSNGTESNRPTSINSKSRSIHENTETVIDKIPHCTSTTLQQQQHPQRQQQPFSQPNSPNFGLETLLRDQRDSKTDSYNTLGYQNDKNATHTNNYNAFNNTVGKQNDHTNNQLTSFNYNHIPSKSLHSKSFNSKSMSMVDTMPHSSSGSTNNRSLTAYWLMETGGGVDSLGYERPSLIRTSIPSQTNSATSNSENNNNIPMFIDQSGNIDFLERTICNHQSLRKTKANPLTT